MKKDKVYLQHILDAIKDTEKFLENTSPETFQENREKQYATLRALEIIGEASKNLSGELKNKNPQVQWKEITGMRDKLIHAYFGVNLNLVWETTQKSLPILKQQITNILKTTQ